MVLIAYDYMNKPKSIEVTKPIDYMRVQVISGDEVIAIYYKDNTIDELDSGNHRVMEFLDYRYFLRGQDINDWADFEFSGIAANTASYERAKYWCKILKERNAKSTEKEENTNE